MKEAAGRETGVEEAGEDAQERSAREVVELLQELRVVLPGVQVLFAFLLTVPFTQRFAQLTALQQDVFFATLLCTAAATALLIAPSGVIFVITDLMFGSPTALGVTVAMAASFVLLWFLLPLRYR